MTTELVPVTRVVTDTEDALRGYLAARHSRGTLLTPIEQIKATPLTKDTSRFWVRVTVLEPVPRQTLRARVAVFDRAHPIAGAMLKALAFGLTVLIGFLLIALALIHLIKREVTSLPFGPIGFGVVILALLCLVLSRRTKGRHAGHTGEGFHWSKCK